MTQAGTGFFSGAIEREMKTSFVRQQRSLLVRFLAQAERRRAALGVESARPRAAPGCGDPRLRPGKQTNRNQVRGGDASLPSRNPSPQWSGAAHRAAAECGEECDKC